MRSVAACLLVFTCFCTTSAVATDASSVAVDRLFDGFQSASGPGCAVAASRDGVTVYESGFGMANLETGTAINSNSIFHVASVSKQFTAASIMLLAREGRLSLDDDIRKYLPEIPDYGTTITLRHLMNHTSGLRDQWDLLRLSRGRFEENRITEYDVMEIVPRQKTLNFKPGDEFLYSNTGYTLLAVTVRRVSGKPLKDFAKERIFAPLGMRSTHFHDDYTMVVPGRASAYGRRTDSSAWHVSIPNFDTYGATSLFTTVGDLLKWEDNFRTLTVGDAQLFKQMETAGVLNSSARTRHGLGLFVGRYRGARFVEHGGADAGYRAYVGRFPDHGLAIAIACNAATARTTDLARSIADVFLGDQLSAVVPITRTDPKFTNVELASRAGFYVQPTTLSLIELTAVDGNLVAGGKGGAVLAQVGDNRYQGVAAREFIEFVSGEPGGINHFVLEQPPVFYQRHAVKASPSAALDAYKGDYVSEELNNARYRISVEDGRLMVSISANPPRPARLLFARTFHLEGGMTIQFQERGGHVTGFEITTGRVRHLKFVREATAGTAISATMDASLGR